MSGHDSIETVLSDFSRSFPRLHAESFYEPNTRSVRLEISSETKSQRSLADEVIHQSNAPGDAIRATMNELLEQIQEQALDTFVLRPRLEAARHRAIEELERAVKLMEGMIDVQQKARQEPRLTVEGQARISGELAGLRLAVATMTSSIERMEGTV